MRTPSFRFVLAAALLMGAGVFLAAQGMGRGPGQGPGAGRGLQRLQLTEPQRAQVKAIQERHQAAIQAKAEAAQAAHRALREALADPAADAKNLQVLHEKASAARFAVMLERRAVHAEILPLLTPEQKDRFEKMPMGPGRGAGRGPRHGRGPGQNPDCPMTK